MWFACWNMVNRRYLFKQFKITSLHDVMNCLYALIHSKTVIKMPSTITSYFGHYYSWSTMAVIIYSPWSYIKSIYFDLNMSIVKHNYPLFRALLFMAIIIYSPWNHIKFVYFYLISWSIMAVISYSPWSY